MAGRLISRHGNKSPVLSLIIGKDPVIPPENKISVIARRYQVQAKGSIRNNPHIDFLQTSFLGINRCNSHTFLPILYHGIGFAIFSNADPSQHAGSIVPERNPCYQAALGIYHQEEILVCIACAFQIQVALPVCRKLPDKAVAAYPPKGYVPLPEGRKVDFPQKFSLTA